MSVISTVARREWTEMRRDGRLCAAAILVLLLLLAAFVSGAKQYRNRAAETREARQAGRDQWTDQAAKNPHDAAHFGQYAVKTQTPLSLFDPGVDAYTGTATLLEAHKRHEASFRAARDTAALARFSELTASGVLQYLIPLLLLLFTFPVFAGEREAGTLRQALSLGVSPQDMALGKALGVAGGLGIFLVPAALLGASALLLTAGAGGVDSGISGRLVVLTLAYLGYFGAFVGIGLAVSARARTAQSALIFLLSFWLVSTVLIPRGVAAWARQIVPLPSEVQFARWITESKAEHARATGKSGRAAMTALQKDLMRQYGVSRVEDLPVNWMGIGLQRGEEENSVLLEKSYDRLWQTMARQNQWYRAASAVAPVLAVRSLSMGVAGTDWDAYRDYARAAERHRQDYVKTLNNDLTQHSRNGDWSYKADRSVWSSIPEFAFRPTDLAGVLSRQGPSLLVIGLWFGGTVFLALLSSARMRAL